MCEEEKETEIIIRWRRRRKRRRTRISRRRRTERRKGMDDQNKSVSKQTAADQSQELHSVIIYQNINTSTTLLRNQIRIFYRIAANKAEFIL